MFEVIRFFPSAVNPRRNYRFLASAFVLSILVSCSAVPTANLEKKYLQTVRELRLVPVYPPREEYQVGDVFFVVYDPDDVDNLDNYERTWLASLPSVMTVANEYLSSRINFPNSTLNADNSEILVKPPQTDLNSSIVTLDDGARRTLPLVNFPSISGRASTAGAFGGYGFLQSFGLAFGRSETVDLNFGDTRAFGLPDGALAINNRYEREFKRRACGNLKLTKNFYSVPVNPEGYEDGTDRRTMYQCPAGRQCDVTIVTRTIRTRKMSFTYTSAAITRLALSQLRGAPDPDNPTTLPIPGNLDINVTVTPDNGETQLDAALDSIVGDVNTALEASKVDGGETSGLSFVGIRGRGLQFDRVFIKPVTIAYEGVSDDPEAFVQNICNNPHY